MTEMIKKFLKDEEGASMVEYALLITLVSVALVTAIGLFSEAIEGVFTEITKTLNGDEGTT